MNSNGWNSLRLWFEGSEALQKRRAELYARLKDIEEDDNLFHSKLEEFAGTSFASVLQLPLFAKRYEECVSEIELAGSLDELRTAVLKIKDVIELAVSLIKDAIERGAYSLSGNDSVNSLKMTRTGLQNVETSVFEDYSCWGSVIPQFNPLVESCIGMRRFFGCSIGTMHGHSCIWGALRPLDPERYVEEQKAKARHTLDEKLRLCVGESKKVLRSVCLQLHNNYKQKNEREVRCLQREVCKCEELMQQTLEAQRQTKQRQISHEKECGEKIALSDSKIEIGVVAPATAHQNEDVWIQVCGDVEGRVLALIEEAVDRDCFNGASVRRRFPVRVSSGDTLRFVLSIRGLEIVENSQEVIWRDDPFQLDFVAYIPNDATIGAHAARIAVDVNGLPIGKFCFMLNIVKAEVSDKRPAEIVAKAYKRYFISYASDDFDRVAARVQGMAIADKNIDEHSFWDKMFLKPGDRYEKIIYDYIDNKADAFLLF